MPNYLIEAKIAKQPEMKELFRRFKEWKLRPYQVAPLSEEQHDCATCGTHYQGNYCPRCGQSAKIGRYSFKNAFMLFLDVWGLGNRGMFRSIRDLLLRPGYMIRDYLNGMQMAYFPPFQMFFLLCALSLVVDTGFNIQGVNRMKQQKKEANELVFGTNTKQEKTNKIEIKVTQQPGKTATKEAEKTELANEEFNRIAEKSSEWMEQHMSVFSLICLLAFSLPLWLLFRHGPNIPDIRLSECFVAMVYVVNMILIIGIVPSLFCFSMKGEIIYSLLTLMLVIIPLKQLFGFSYWGTIWRVAIAAMSLFVAMILLIIVLVLLYLFVYI